MKTPFVLGSSPLRLRIWEKPSEPQGLQSALNALWHEFFINGAVTLDAGNVDPYVHGMAHSAQTRLEIPTAIPGFRLWPGLLDTSAQQSLIDQTLERVAKAPLYQPITPGGRALSVHMTNFGSLGWVSDRQGYRYQGEHPITHQPWPDIPPLLLDLWQSLTQWPEPPDACLVNLYRQDAKMGLHQDKDEQDLSAPVLSVSLGDTALFRIGPAEGGPTRTVQLRSGDVCMLSGPARLARHGIDRVLTGSSTRLPDGGRLNLTLRKAGKPSF